MRSHGYEAFAEREPVRQHMSAAHHWPAIWRYDASMKDLKRLHRDMHDPGADRDMLITRVRQTLGMPDEDLTGESCQDDD
jgi:hypothetical protein